MSYRFLTAGEIPENMAFVPAGNARNILLAGLSYIPTEPTGDFAMDRCEVTNRAYKSFVDAGGYTDPRYWREPFVVGKRRLTWREAVARFTDRTGRPGPATWEVGTYPKDKGDFPVSGVSWYEAAAYAEWADKSLPTVFHWSRVAFVSASASIVPRAISMAGDPSRWDQLIAQTGSGSRTLPATCVNGCGTRAKAARSGSFWGAGGTIRITRSRPPLRSLLSTARPQTVSDASDT